MAPKGQSAITFDNSYVRTPIQRSKIGEELLTRSYSPILPCLKAKWYPPRLYRALNRTVWPVFTPYLLQKPALSSRQYRHGNSDG